MASNMKAVAKTNPEMPSNSLMKKICHPKGFRVSTKATRYNCRRSVMKLFTQADIVNIIIISIMHRKTIHTRRSQMYH